MDRHNRNVARLPSPGQVGTVLVSSATAFAKRNKVITGSYFFGLLLLIFVGSGTRLTMEQQRQYNHIMSTIDLDAEYEASSRYYHALAAYRATKGWFTCDSLCQRNRDRMHAAQSDLDAIRQEGYARMSDAKSIAGLFSQVGIGEVKDKFWETFHSGKSFAKRMSMWDAMFMGVRSMARDESVVEYGIKLLMQILLNFSIGLIVALVTFVLGLWSIVQSYQPDPITAVAFFVGATCAAFAFVSTYLFMIYGAAAGTLYGVAKVVETNARLQDGGGGRGRRRRQHVGYHAHYD